MALVSGQMVISAGCFASAAGGVVADLSVGTLVPEGVAVGVFDAEAADEVRWASGSSDIEAYALGNLRLVTPYSGTDMLGKCVTLPNTSPAFRGIVIQQFNTELDDVDGNGTQVPVLVIQADGFTYIAEPASVEEV